MIQELNSETVATRGKAARLSIKLSHNLMDFSVEAHLKTSNERRTRWSHAIKFVVPRAKKDIFKFSFFWNSLPVDIVNKTSVDSFKSKLVSY